MLLAVYAILIKKPTGKRLYSCFNLVSQARPNQPQRRSLSVSRMGKEGSGDSVGFRVRVECINAEVTRLIFDKAIN